MPLKALKTVIREFYDVEEIYFAKGMLLDDARKLQTNDKFPHVSARREGDNRAAKEVDDMVTILTFLDERKLLKSLPRYVYDNPERIPPTHLDEGDMKFIFSYMERMNHNIEALGAQMSAQMAAMAKEVHALQWLQTKPVLPAGPGQAELLPLRPAPAPHQQQQTGAQPGVNKPVVHPTAATAAAAAASDKFMNDFPSLAVSTPRRGYADPAGAGTFIHGSQQSHVPDWAAESKPESGDEQAQFQEYMSRKRRRELWKLQQQETDDAQKSAVAGGQSRRAQRRAPLLVGKASGESTDQTNGLVAAERIVKQAVFYVDNVKETFTAEQMFKFVSDMSVEVVSVYKVKERKRRNRNRNKKTDDDETDASAAGAAKDDEKDELKAFRISINRDDREKFLDEDKWPAFVCVSTWNFKPRKEEDGTKYKRSRISSQSDTSSQHRTSVHSDVEDMDATVLSCPAGIDSNKPN